MNQPASRAARRARTAQRILEAAQAEFGEHGLGGATIRAIAKRAEVDPSLVMQHYGSKQDLFAIAVQLPPGSAHSEVLDHLFDVVDVRLNDLPPEARTLVRSMLTAPAVTEYMRAFLNERVSNLAQDAAADPDAGLRAALVVSSILGITIARHFLELDELVDLPEDRVRAAVAPWLAAAFPGEARRAAPAPAETSEPS